MKVLITGISSGIGRALTKQLLADGHDVWGIARRAEMLHALVKECATLRLLTTTGDVRVPETIMRMRAEMSAADFLPDVVVLNAGTHALDLVPAFDYKKFRKIFSTNTLAPLSLVSEFLPAFMERAAGHFIAISSVSAFRGNAQSAGYPASKAALSRAFECLRLRYRSSGIAFTVMHFGPVATPMWKGGAFPFLLTAEQAACAVSRAVSERKAVYNVPWQTAFAMKAAGIIPYDILARLFAYIRRAE